MNLQWWVRMQTTLTTAIATASAAKIIPNRRINLRPCAYESEVAGRKDNRATLRVIAIPKNINTAATTEMAASIEVATLDPTSSKDHAAYTVPTKISHIQPPAAPRFRRRS